MYPRACVKDPVCTAVSVTFVHHTIEECHIGPKCSVVVQSLLSHSQPHKPHGGGLPRHRPSSDNDTHSRHTSLACSRVRTAAPPHLPQSNCNAPPPHHPFLRCKITSHPSRVGTRTQHSPEDQGSPDHQPRVVLGLPSGLHVAVQLHPTGANCGVHGSVWAVGMLQATAGQREPSPGQRCGRLGPSSEGAAHRHKSLP